MTLFGHSSGASSIHFHMMSENSRGLFHKAIIMAGTSLVGGRPRLSRRRILAEKVSINLGFYSSNEGQVLSFLEDQNPADIVEIADDLFKNAEFDESFGPTIEAYDSSDVFINDKMIQNMQNAWGNEIPLIIGATSLESLDLAEQLQKVPQFFSEAADFQNYIPKELNVVRDSEKSKKYAQMIKETYYGDSEPSITNAAGLMNVYSDSTLWLAIKRSIQYRVKDKKAPTFVYRFDARTENSLFRQYLGGVDTYRGAMHGEDFTHLFKTFMHGPLSKMQAEAFITMQFMVSAFTNFAINGDPSIPDHSIWPAVDDDDKVLMGLNINESMSHVLLFPESERLQVFEEIYALESGAATLFTVGLVKLSLLTVTSRFLL